MKYTAFFFFFAFNSCYAEWDIPKTQRIDPCTRKVDEKYIYVAPTCAYPPIQIQKQHPQGQQMNLNGR